MRFLEILLVLVSAARMALPLFTRGRWVNWMGVAALGVLGLHLYLEGWRWQMLPVYGIAIGLGIYSLWRLTTPNSSPAPLTMGGYTVIVGGLLLLGIAVLPAVLLPIPKLPAPTGPYPVGTMQFMLVDESRPELYAETPGEPRAIMVQVWYPAEPPASKAEPAPWIDHVEITGPALADFLGKPPFFFDHLRYARTNALPDAPVSGAAAQYPLLLFSHGWQGLRTQSTFLMEELASYGYIVAAPDHTYGALATVFPDGRAAMSNPAALPYDMGIPEAAYQQAARQLGAQWAADLRFILETLAAPEAGSPAARLRYRVDFSRVGVLGHSTGGGAAIQFCADDWRCRAALGLDPYMMPVSPAVIKTGLEQPYLGIFSAVWAQDVPSGNNEIFEQFAGNSSGEVYRFYIRQTTHYDFTDIGAFSPLAAQIGLKGPLDGAQVQRIVRAYALAFFDHTLRGADASILESAAFPEIVKWDVGR